MKKIQYGILIAILPLVVAFAYNFTPFKPLSMIQDLSLEPVQLSISNTRYKAVFKNHFYFSNYFTETGEEIWQVDAQGNANLVKETIIGPNNFILKKMLNSDGSLYMIYSSDVGGDIIYHLQEPSADLELIETGLILSTESIKLKNDKLFAIGYNQATRKSEVIIVDSGALQNISDIHNTNTFAIDAVEELNNEIYFLGRGEGQNKLFKKTNDGFEVIYEEAGNWLGRLSSTDTHLYFSVDRGFDIGTALIAFDGQVFNELETFKSIYNKQLNYGNHLALFAQRHGDTYPELWVTNGNILNAVTNFRASNSGEIENHIVVADVAYYLQIDAKGTSLFYLNGLISQKVELPITSYSNNIDMLYAQFQNTLFVSGIVGTGPSSERGIWGVENGQVSNVFIKSGGLIPLVYANHNGVYLLETIENVYPQQKKLYRYNPETKAVEFIIDLDSSTNEVVGIDTDRVFLASSNNTPYQSLSKVENGIHLGLYATGVTGSSNPKGFLPINDKTYFIAKHDEYGESVWESDGLSAQVLGDVSGGSQSAQIKKLYELDGSLIFAVHDNGLVTFWKSEGESLEKLSSKNFALIQQDLVFTGSSIYFVGTDGRPGSSSLWVIKSSGIYPVVANGSNLTLTPFNLTHTAVGTFFRTNTEQNSQLWSINEATASEISWNELMPHGDPYTGSEFLSDGDNLYYLSCINSALVIHGYSRINGLEAVKGPNLTGVDCSQVKTYALDDEVLLFTNQNNEHQLWTLKNKELVLNPESFYQVGTGFETVKNNALYFIARDNAASATTIFIYNNGQVVNTSIEAEKMWVTNTSTGQNVTWVISYNNYGYPESHEIYKVSGDGATELITQISGDKGNVLSVTEVEGRALIQTANSRREVDLLQLNSQGQLVSLVQQAEFSYGGFNDARQQYPISSGHGKWLFLKACDYMKGCEPYSLDYNIPPSAKIISNKESYYAGTQVVLSAKESSDPDNDNLIYSWRQVSGENVQFEVSEGEIATFEAPGVQQEQIISIELEVMDEGYAKVTDVIDIAIVPNAKPVVKIKAPLSATEGDTVQLNGTESTDEESFNLSYHWTVISGVNVSINNSNGANASFVVPTLGQSSMVTIGLTVTDEVGAKSQETITISLKKIASEGAGGGGGSTNWLLLMMLATLMMLRFGYHRK